MRLKCYLGSEFLRGPLILTLPWEATDRDPSVHQVLAGGKWETPKIHGHPFVHTTRTLDAKRKQSRHAIWKSKEAWN